MSSVLKLSIRQLLFLKPKKVKTYMYADGGDVKAGYKRIDRRLGNSPGTATTGRQLGSTAVYEPRVSDQSGTSG
jgi:hypothetical protein